MPAIPGNLNGVAIVFDNGADNDVEPAMLTALGWLVRPGVPYRHLITALFVKSVRDRHRWPSRHVQRKAVDISRINGRRIADGYGRDSATTEIVQRLQLEFENIPNRRENFGPFMKHKHGKPYRVGGHLDHIHLSID